MDVTDARPDQERQINAVAWNLVAHDVELQRLVRALAQNGDANGRSLGAFEQISNIGSTHVVGGLTVDGGNDVAWTNAGSISWRAHERSDDDDFIIARTHRHADPVVLAALFFAEERVGLGIEEIRMGIEGMQHARNRAVIDGFVSVDWLSVVLLDDVEHLGERLQAVPNVGVAVGQWGRSIPLCEEHAQKAAKDKNQYDKEERATSTTNHRFVSFGWGMQGHPGHR